MQAPAACLVLAPLAWLSRRRRSMVALLGLLTFFSLSWSFNIPPLVSLLRLPGLNLLSHNRMSFVAAFALTALAAIGLEALLHKEVGRRGWFWVPGLALLTLFAWCVYRAFVLPEPIATELGALVSKSPIRDINEPWEVAAIQQSFRTAYGANAVFCALGAASWGVLLFGSGVRRWFAPSLAALLLIELGYFGYGHAAQTEPELYFPRVPVLERLAKSPEGRIIGFNCLPANLAQAAGLADVRGYDGIDPSRMVQLLLAARNSKFPSPSYAATQMISPMMFPDPATGEPRMPPIMDMLNVRYVVFRGTPPEGIQPLYKDEDYWVFSNERAMPRAYIPRNTQVIPDGQLRLQALSRDTFDPRDTAYLEQPADLPMNASGSVQFVEDMPQSITLSAKMRTAGLVVLADRWDPGWKAYVNDTADPILRVNHALRGVEVAPVTVPSASSMNRPASIEG